MSPTEVIDRGGVLIAYEATGAGPTVLATHGFTSSSHVWSALAEVLAPTHRVIVWDIRGHGRSGSPEAQAAYSADVSVADMLAVLDEVAAARAVLIGHSLGGYLSLEFQLRHPERVAGMILVGTGPGYRKDEARAGWNELAERSAAALERRGLDALPTSGEVERSVHRDALGLARAARGIMRQQDSRVLEHLGAIEVPTLVVVGEDDAAFLAGSRYMAEKVPRAELAVVPGAAHSPMTATPGAFHALVVDFLERTGL